MVSVRQMMGLVTLVANVVKDSVRDPKEQAAVFMGLQRILRPLPASQTVADLSAGAAAKEPA